MKLIIFIVFDNYVSAVGGNNLGCRSKAIELSDHVSEFLTNSRHVRISSISKLGGPQIIVNKHMFNK